MTATEYLSRFEPARAKHIAALALNQDGIEKSLRVISTRTVPMHVKSTPKSGLSKEFEALLANMAPAELRALLNDLETLPAT